MEYRCPTCGVFIAPTSTVEEHEKTRTHIETARLLEFIERQRANDRPAEPKADIDPAEST